MKKGIDVSKYQKPRNLEIAGLEGIDFLLIKAIGKGLQVDPEAINHINLARKHKIPYGLYVYSYAKTNVEALDEAIAVINFIQDNGIHDIELPIYIDIEEKKSIPNINNIAYMFTEQIKLAGLKAGIYTYASAFKYVDMGRFPDCSFWISRMFNNMPEPYAETYLSSGFDIYQYGKESWRYGEKAYMEVDVNVADNKFLSGLFNQVVKEEPDQVAPEDVMMTVVKKGSKGKAVKVWQAILGNVAIDGIFGPDTLKKTRLFQKEHNLTQDGCVGPNTWRAGLKSV